MTSERSDRQSDENIISIIHVVHLAKIIIIKVTEAPGETTRCPHRMQETRSSDTTVGIQLVAALQLLSNALHYVNFSQKLKQQK